ncbi:MAG: biosynthetic-type acetolactate synthase large subunit [Lachnospiraceae bacterium]
MQLNGSDIIAEVLLEHGVDTVFGYPGGAVLNIYDALYKYRNRIHHVLTAHEQGASHAADGYARATGKTGVVIATSGPGATNLVTGIATAYMDSVPMVAITGNVGTSLIGRDAFQEVYITGITMPITKHNFMVQDISELAPILREAFKIANSGRKGPVLVDIPKDITAAVTDFETAAPVSIADATVIDADKIKAVAKLVNSAKRPILELGGGVISSEASEVTRAFVEKTGIPTCHTLMAAGVLGYDEPLNYGLVGMHGSLVTNKAIDEADLLIAVGTRFSDRVALNTERFAKKAKVVQIDIDLSEINKNVMVDAYLTGDVKAILTALLPLVKSADRSAWIETLETYKKEDYIPQDDPDRITPHELVRAICEGTDKETVYVTDVGQHQMWAAQYIHHTGARNFLTSGGLGTMGYGYGAAIGAQFAFPEKRVVHITGDGSFHMNLNEACTAVSNNLPIITVIFDNRVLGMVRQWQTCFYGKRYSQTDPERQTDFVKVIEGFGGKGYRASTLAEFKAAYKQAQQDNCPVWIDCTIDKDDRVLPLIPAGKTVDDIITAPNCATCRHKCHEK